MEESTFTLIEYKDLIGKRILIAEDNLLNQIIIRKILEKWLVAFTIVTDGQKALDKCIEEKFDLILMDIQMPVLDGYSASKEIRNQNHGHSQIPIIALTASISDELKEEIEAAGMNDFLIKPYSPEALHDLLIRYLK